MRLLPNKHPTLGTTEAPEVSMPLNPPCDDAGNPINDEQYARLCERDYAERDAQDGLRVERCVSPFPGLEALRVVDSVGHVQGFIAFPIETMDMDLPRRMLARARRMETAPMPPLKLVG